MVVLFGVADGAAHQAELLDIDVPLALHVQTFLLGIHLLQPGKDRVRLRALPQWVEPAAMIELKRLCRDLVSLYWLRVSRRRRRRRHSESIIELFT